MHLPNVCTFPDEMDSMAVPERVRVNAITNARQTRIFLNKLPHPYALDMKDMSILGGCLCRECTSRA